MEVGIMVRVTFYFSGHSDIGGWQDTPPHPQNLNGTKHECNGEKIISIEVSKCILQSTPPPPSPVPYFMPEKETCEFQFQIDIGKSEFLVFRSQ